LSSILIGLTLAVDENFKVLLIVVIFHRTSCYLRLYTFSDPCRAETFEGLGIGSRLAYLELPNHLSWIRIAGAILYAVTTPIGIAAGLGVRTTYNPNSPTASIVSGVMDSLSAGILLYTGTVEVRILSCIHSKANVLFSFWPMIFYLIRRCSMRQMAILRMPLDVC